MFSKVENDPYETINTSPKWIAPFLKDGGKIEDEHALHAWMIQHGIKVTIDLSSVADYAAQDD